MRKSPIMRFFESTTGKMAIRGDEQTIQYKKWKKKRSVAIKISFNDSIDKIKIGLSYMTCNELANVFKNFNIELETMILGGAVNFNERTKTFYSDDTKKKRLVKELNKKLLINNLIFEIRKERRKKKDKPIPKKETHNYRIMYMQNDVYSGTSKKKAYKIYNFYVKLSKEDLEEGESVYLFEDNELEEVYDPPN